MQKMEEIMEFLKVILEVPVINIYSTRIFTFMNVEKNGSSFKWRK